MKTIIGDVKSIRDFFKDSKLTEVAENEFGKVYSEEVTCKLCGEKLEAISNKGACHSNMFLIENAMKEHIDFHKTVKELNE